jgi:hypothetical protein
MEAVLVAAEIRTKLTVVTSTTSQLETAANTYKDALLEAPAQVGQSRGGHGEVDPAIGRNADRRSRQVLIDFMDDQMTSLSETALKEKVMGAIKQVSSPPPPKKLIPVAGNKVTVDIRPLPVLSRWPVDNSRRALLGPTRIKAPPAPAFFLLYSNNICDPPRSPQSYPYQQMSTLDNSHALSLSVLLLFPKRTFDVSSRASFISTFQSMDLETKGGSSFIHCCSTARVLQLALRSLCGTSTLHNAASPNACFLLCSECSNLSASLANATKGFRWHVGAKLRAKHKSTLVKPML